MVNIQSARAAKLNEKRLELRRQYWPDVPEDVLWHRKKSKGFITKPSHVAIGAFHSQ